MNIKLILAGAGTAIAGLGVGIGIPIMANAGFAVTSYEQAQAILNGTPWNNDVSQTSEKSAVSNANDVEKSGTAITAGTNDDVQNAQGTDTAGNATDNAEEKTASADAQSEEKQEDNRAVDPDADIVFDWTFADWKALGVPMVDSDMDAVINAVGLQKEQVVYSGNSFTINRDPIEWNGKKAYLLIQSQDDSNNVTQLFWDGTKYVDDSLDEAEPSKKTVCINGSYADPNNNKGKWSLGYEFDRENNGQKMDDLWFSNYPDGISGSDISEISGAATVPFIGGTFEDMDAALHTSAMIAKGMKDESGGQGNEKYIVDTSLGKCVLNIYTSETDGKTNKLYFYEWEKGKYEIQVSFASGSEIATSTDYRYRY